MNKIRIPIQLSVVALVSILPTFTGCSSTGDAGDESSRTVDNAVADAQGTETGDLDPDHGLVKIHRYGEGYDIKLILDAADSDVNFKIQLSPDDVAQLQAADKRAKSNDAAQSGETEMGVERAEADAEAGGSEQARSDDQEEVNDPVKGRSPEEVAKKTANKYKAANEHIWSSQHYFYEQRYIDALESVKEALKILPESPNAYALQGSIYYKMGLNDKARRSWETALKIDPDMDDVRAGIKMLEQKL